MNNDFKHTKQLEELKKVTEELKNSKEAKVITINGGWGSGKTTLAKKFLENQDPSNQKKYVEMNVWNSWYEDDLMFYLYMKVRNLSGGSLTRNLLNTLIIVFLIPIFLYFIALFGVDKNIKDLDIRWKNSIILVILIITIIICVLCFLKRKKANEFSVLQLSILNFLIVSNKFNYYIYEEIIKIIKNNIEKHKIEYIVIEDIDRLTPKGLSNLINLIDKLISEEFSVTFLVLGDINLTMKKLHDDKSYVGSENFFEKIEHLRIDMYKEYITFYNFLTEMESTREEMKYISVFEKKQWEILLSNIESRLSLRFLEKFGKYYAIKKKELHSENLFNVFVEYYSQMKDVKMLEVDDSANKNDHRSPTELNLFLSGEEKSPIYLNNEIVSVLELDIPFRKSLKIPILSKETLTIAKNEKIADINFTNVDSQADYDSQTDYDFYLDDNDANEDDKTETIYETRKIKTIQNIFQEYNKGNRSNSWNSRLIKMLSNNVEIELSNQEKMSLKVYYKFLENFRLAENASPILYDIIADIDIEPEIDVRKRRFIIFMLSEVRLKQKRNIFSHFSNGNKMLEEDMFLAENLNYIEDKEETARIEAIQKKLVNNSHDLLEKIKQTYETHNIDISLLLSFWTWLWTVEGKIDDGYEGVLKVKLDEVFEEIIND